MCKYREKENIKIKGEYMSIHKKLLDIQTKLKAPKGQYNNFGKYKYRNCEDILEAAKPLLAEVGCVLTLEDDIWQVDNRFYVKTTAKIVDIESSDEITTVAFAREEDSKKGMDGSQVTGASSSYARKYALNGLFCIDDTKDSDVTNNGETDKSTNKNTPQKTDKESDDKLENAIKAIDSLVNTLTQNGVDKKVIGDTIKNHFERNGKKSANYNAIKDVEVATNVYKALKKLEVKE